MTKNLYELPDDLPIPVDNGAASHLPGSFLPHYVLPGTDQAMMGLGRLRGCWVVYIYPRTGRPGVPSSDGWDVIPGARLHATGM